MANKVGEHNYPDTLVTAGDFMELTGMPAASVSNWAKAQNHIGGYPPARVAAARDENIFPRFYRAVDVDPAYRPAEWWVTFRQDADAWVQRWKNYENWAKENGLRIHTNTPNARSRASLRRRDELIKNPPPPAPAKTPTPRAPRPLPTVENPELTVEDIINHYVPKTPEALAGRAGRIVRGHTEMDFAELAKKRLLLEQPKELLTLFHDSLTKVMDQQADGVYDGALGPIDGACTHFVECTSAIIIDGLYEFKVTVERVK